MKKQTIRLKESDLNKIVKESVNNIIKEAFDPYKDGGVYGDLLDDLESAYNDYFDAINKIQQFFLEHDDTANDMDNSLAGKYGEEAKNLLVQSYDRISKLFY